MRGVLPLGAICCVVLLAACSPTTPQACPADAKLCPDGSAVGRAGPNCEFAACPDAPPAQESTPQPTSTSVHQETVQAKRYVSESLADCSRIRYTCDAAESSFQDERGCGCRYPETRFVIDSHVNGELCTTQYDPVCGVTQSGKQTFSNSCEAIKNSKVSYYTPGACPGAAAQPADAQPTPVVEQEQVASGTCDPTNKPTNCARTSDAVCGDDGRDYMNWCFACSSGKVNTYTAGKCVVTGSVPFLATRCTADIAGQDCSQGYHDQVCGYQYGGGKTTFDNKCAACQDSTVAYYYGGVCAGDAATPTKVTKAKQSCNIPRPTDCPTTDAPVCGYAETESKTYSNSCVACADELVQFFFAGACA